MQNEHYLQGKDKEELDNRKIEIGTDIDEFAHSPTGNFIINVWEQKISLTCYDAMFGKRKGEYSSQTLPDFMLNRGFALGIQWVIDDLKSRINTAHRLLEEKKEQQEQEKKS